MIDIEATLWSRPSSSLTKNVQEIIKKSGAQKWITVMVVCTVLSAVCSYYDLTLMSTIIEGSEKTLDDGLAYYIVMLACIEVLNKCTHTISVNIMARKLMPKLTRTARYHMYDLIEEADPEYIDKQKDINATVSDGVGAVNDCVMNILKFLRPIFQLVSQLIVVSEVGGVYGIITCIIVLAVAFVGLNVLRFGFNTRKKINRQTNKKRAFARGTAKSFLKNVLNGSSARTKEEIINTLEECDHKYRIYNAHMAAGFAGIETFHNTIMTLALLAISRTIPSKEFIVLFVLVKRVCNTAWYLFYSINNLLVSTSKWGGMEKLLEEFILAPVPSVIPLDPSRVISTFSDSSIREIRVCGKSAAGKSTWMKRTVIRLYRKFRRGEWLYLDQRMSLPDTARNIASVMGDFLPTRTRVDLDILYAFSDTLEISNVINPDTINTPFKSPSGGEEKRILFLRAIIPVLMRRTNVRMLFCDEVTAGLDGESWAAVRKVIDQMKRDYNIRFVTVDHHDFEADANVYVNKKFINPAEGIDMRPKRSMNFIDRFFNIYRDQDENKRPAKDVVVWLDVEDEP